MRKINTTWEKKKRNWKEKREKKMRLFLISGLLEKKIKRKKAKKISSFIWLGRKPEKRKEYIRKMT